MKKLMTIMLLGLFLVSLVSSYEAGCPGSQFAEVQVGYSISPSVDCLIPQIGTRCHNTAQIYLDFSNRDCDKTIIYISGDGTENEILPKGYYEEEIATSEVGVEWTREFYFKDNPSEKFLINAKNYAPEEFDILIGKKVAFCRAEAGEDRGEAYMSCMKRHPISEFENGSPDPKPEPTNIGFLGKLWIWITDLFS